MLIYFHLNRILTWLPNSGGVSYVGPVDAWALLLAAQAPTGLSVQTQAQCLGKLLLLSRLQVCGMEVTACSRVVRSKIIYMGSTAPNTW